MMTGRAVMIFNDINNDVFSENEKGLAIWTVMNMPTHNGITKDKMIEVIRWLWNQSFEIEH